MLHRLVTIAWLILAGNIPNSAQAQIPASGTDQNRMPQVVVQQGHAKAIYSLTQSVEGTLLTTSDDLTLKLWDTSTGLLIRTIGPFPTSLRLVAPIVGSSRVWTGSDENLYLVDINSGETIAVANAGPHGSYDLAMSPDGKYLVAIHHWGISLRSSKTGVELHRASWWKDRSRWLSLFRQETLEPSARKIAFSPDSQSIYLAMTDGSLVKWSLQRLIQIETVYKHNKPIDTLALSRDGAFIAIGDEAGHLIVMQRSDAKVVFSAKAPGGSFRSIAWSPDGQSLATGGKSGTVVIWRASDGSISHSSKAEFLINNVLYLQGGQRVAVSSSAVILDILDTPTGLMTKMFGGDGANIEVLKSSRLGDVFLSVTAAAGDDYARQINVWDGKSGRLVQTFEKPSVVIPPGAAFTPSGQHFILPGAAGKLNEVFSVVREPIQFRPQMALRGHDRTLAVSSAAAMIAVTHFTERDADLRIIDLLSGEYRTIRGVIEPPLSAAFSEDGQLLAAGMYGNVKVWNVADDALVAELAMPLKREGISAIAIASGSKRLVTGARDGKIRLWDFGTSTLLQTFDGHAGAIKTLKFLPGENGIISSSRDRTVRVWDIGGGRARHTSQLLNNEFEGPLDVSADGKKIVAADASKLVLMDQSLKSIATSIASSNRYWLSITKDGFFNSGGDSSQLVHVVRGNKTFNIKQVHQSLYHPDLVREAFMGDNNGEVASAARVVSLDKVLDSGPAPDVELAPIPASSNSDVIAVSASITDRGKGVGRIEWRVNGVTAAVSQGPIGQRKVHLSQDLALDPGSNVIEVVAYNRSNLLASYPAARHTSFTGVAVEDAPKLHILAIGIDNYIDTGWSETGKPEDLESFSPLRLAAKDAKTFANDFAVAARPLFSEVKVMVRVNEAATRAALDEAFDQFKASISSRDTFILFIAGHGVASRSEGKFYFIPQDYDGGRNPARLEERAVGQDRFQSWLSNKIRAKRALVLLDTCESGALISGYSSSRVEGSASDGSIGRLHEATGRPVLTAAAKGTPAYEDDQGTLNVKHGIFTWALLESLRKAEADADGNIRLLDIVSYVQKRVPQLAAALGGEGSTKSAVNVAARPTLETSASPGQSARFGSRGEDFVLARRLPQ